MKPMQEIDGCARAGILRWVRLTWHALLPCYAQPADLTLC